MECLSDSIKRVKNNIIWFIWFASTLAQDRMREWKRREARANKLNQNSYEFYCYYRWSGATGVLQDPQSAKKKNSITQAT